MWVTPSARAKYNNKRCQIRSHFSNSVITGAISLKLGIHVGTHQAMHSHVLRLGCYCTCARAGGVSRSRERLGRLRSNLVHGWGPVSRVPCKSHFGPRLHVRTCRMPLPDLRNGWADCVQIWYTASDRLEGCFAQARWKYPVALPHVQGSLSRSLVLRPKGVLLVIRSFVLLILLLSERSERSLSLDYRKFLSMSGRSAVRTLLRGLYLSNHLTDLHAVIFVG